MSKNFKEGVEYDEANDAVQNFRNPSSPFGVIYDTTVMAAYLETTFPRIISQQPDKPDGFKWSVGFYFYKKNAVSSFFVAPILVRIPTPLEANKDELPDVIDCFDPVYGDYFKTDLVYNSKPDFVYDEGALWP